jgi:hypothetical protein
MARRLSRQGFRRFEGLLDGGVVKLRTICGAATNKALTRLDSAGNA